jgi:lipopolysaccharide transport system ATP-binding protein
MSSAAHGEPIIRACNLGKCYQIYARPTDRLKQALYRWKRRFYREFWALRDVSFDIHRGEVVGIIGRNGSGKSTLLQIVAGTLVPTVGEVGVHGRVAALLELGSGFNLEFTGRENVYMNGAILGLPQRFMAERFGEIAAFADIGEFIDQPVKIYSSGMVVRLAFAVQTQLEPDVLIVDEALAVGDEAFQRKCFGWFERFRSRGGTLLFVTHGAQTVVQLCDRALLLEQGRLRATGPSKPVVDIYQKLLYGAPDQAEQVRRWLESVGGRVKEGDEAEVEVASAPPAHVPLAAPTPHYDADMIHPAETTYGTGEANISDVAMLDEHGRPVNVLVSGQRCRWRYRVTFRADVRQVNFGMMIKTKEGIEVVGVSSGHLRQRVAQVAAGQTAEVCFELSLNVAPGTYFLNSGVSCLRDGGEVYLHRRVDVAAIRVIAPDRRDHHGLAFVDARLSHRFVNVAEPAHA